MQSHLSNPSNVEIQLKSSDLSSKVLRALSPASMWMFAPVLLISILIGACGIAYRTLAFRLYSSLPTGFDGPMVFRQKYLLAHHSFLLEQLPVYSYWSAVVNGELGTYLMDFINALVLQFSAFSSLQPRLIHQLILTCTLVSLVIILLTRLQPRAPRFLDVAVVVSLMTLGTPVVINFLNGWNVAYAWGLLLAVTLVYVSNLSTLWKLGLTLVIAVTGPPLYHSFGFLLTVYVVLLWCGNKLLRHRSAVASPVTVLVIYLVYQVYVSTLFFGSLVRGLRDVLDLSFLHRDEPVIAVSKIQTDLVDLQQLHMVLYGILAVPIAIAVFRFAHHSIMQRKHAADDTEQDADSIRYVTAITCMSVAIGIFAMLFGLRFSLEFLINRGASYMIIPAILAVINELRQRRRFYWYVYPLTVIAVAMSVYSFGVQANTSHASTNLTLVEEQGYFWLRDRLSPEDTIFTDFRLSGPFIADGYFRVLGITGEGNEPTKQLLQEIYNAHTPKSITAGIEHIKTYRDGHTANYLFLSKLMMQDYPGLNGYSTRFDPAPASFFQMLRVSQDWHLVYENEQVLIYQRVKAK